MVLYFIQMLIILKSEVHQNHIKALVILVLVVLEGQYPSNKP